MGLKERVFPRSRKIDFAQDDPIKILTSAAIDALYEGTGESLGECLAAVIRVDSYIDGKARVVCRLMPPKDTFGDINNNTVFDAALPNPCEWVSSPEVISDSQYLIDLHRAYEGSTNSRPVVGQACLVIVPYGNPHGVDGMLVEMYDYFLEPGFKSCPDAGDGPQTAANAPIDAGGPNIPTEGVGEAP